MAKSPAGTWDPAWPDGYDEGRQLDRPRLRAMVAKGLEGPLTVLCSPPGFGKSVMLQQALAAPGVSAVVLDDGPGSGDADTVARLRAIVDLWPSGPPVIVACRPGSTVGRWAQHRPGALVIDESSLAFRDHEVRKLMVLATGGHPGEQHVRELMRRTEGWPVAVRVATMAVRGRDDWDQVIGGIDGSEPRIAAFFRQEVLEQQPEAVRRFLLRSSVLHRLDGDAARITGDPVDGGTVLRHLAGERLFVRQEAAGGGTRFGYSGLFRQALLRELRAGQPAAEREVRAAAADWYVDRQEPELAAEYLIEAERWKDLLDLIDRYGRSLYERGLLHRIADWLEQIPSWSAKQRREIRLRRAVARTLLGQAGPAELLARQVRTEEAGSGARALTDVLSARALVPVRPEVAADLSGRAIAALRSGCDAVPNPLGLVSREQLLAMAQVDRARSLWLLGDASGGRAILREVAEAASCPPHLRSEARGAWALLESWAGDHRCAGLLAGQVMKDGWGSGQGAGAADAAMALAHLHREQGHLSTASSWLDRAREIGSGRAGAVEAVWAVETALLSVAGGRPDTGLAVIRDQELTRMAPLPPMLEAALLAAEIRLYLLQGDGPAAEAVLAGAGAPQSPALTGAAIQLALAGSDVALADSLLAGWSCADADFSCTLERELWAAAVDVESGRRRQGYVRLGHVLDRARASGHFRLFLDAGPTIHRLLRILARSAPASYAATVVAALPAGGAEGADRFGLSGREREIIRYLPTSLSSAQMAARLYISVNTLKTHLRTIYRKLGANGRREAILRAEELGLA